MPPMLLPTRRPGPEPEDWTTAPSASAKRSMVLLPSLGGFERPRPGRSHLTTRRRLAKAFLVSHQAVEFSAQPWVRMIAGFP